MLIKIDSREPQGIEELMKLVDEKIEFLREFLLEGDYVCNNVCIERKEISDFCGSIMDGRMESQIERMKKKYDKCYVIVIGRIEDRKTEIHENCVLGMIVSLLVKYKINVITVDNEYQFLYVMKRLFERHADSMRGDREC